MENQKVLANINSIKKKITNTLSKLVDTKIKQNKNIEIIAISKRQPIERVVSALDSGHKIFGENQVQETIKKWPLLKKKYSSIKLHLVGPLQSNKVKDAISIFDFIQTVDREKIAKTLKKGMIPVHFIAALQTCGMWHQYLLRSFCAQGITYSITKYLLDYTRRARWPREALVWKSLKSDVR